MVYSFLETWAADTVLLILSQLKSITNVKHCYASDVDDSGDILFPMLRYFADGYDLAR